MEVIIERACGMDIHKDSITACIMTPEGKLIQTFSTKTVFLLKLFGITVLTKNGIIPLAVLMINSSVVTVSYLLAKVTKLAFYLPDKAGLDMFMFTSDSFHTPFTGGLIMFAWVAVLFIVAAIVFQRRDVTS
ncbi:hypothetical protein ABFY51_03680 [Lysinibacillus pakistanensis]